MSRSTILALLTCGMLAASVTTASDAAAQTRQVTLARVGYPDGVALEGATSAASVSFPLPVGVSVTRASLALVLDATRTAAPGSNLQIFVNGTRRFVVRWLPDSLPALVTIPLEAVDLQRSSVDVQVRSFLSIGSDRCIDERLGSAYATILPGSKLEYDYDPADVHTAAATWSLLGDTVRVAIPSRALTVDELTLAFQLLFELRTDSRAVELVRSPMEADLSLDSTASVRALVAWRRLTTHRGRVVPSDPSLDQLGITDLPRLYGSRGTWRLPIDLRTLPPDRVPSGLDLQVATAPSSTARGVEYFVYMNGTLLRAVPAREDGLPEHLLVDLPGDLLTTYNEIRVEVQRHRDPSDYCQEAEALYPAQIFGSSVLHTARATHEPRLFTGTALRLPDRFPLYLPSDALTRPEQYLPTVVSLARALWGDRTPAISLFGPNDAISPDHGFVMIGAPRGFQPDRAAREDSGRLELRGPAIGQVNLGTRRGDVVVQVTRANGQTGVLVSKPDSSAILADQPENFGNADVVIQSADGNVLRLNTQNLPFETLYGTFTALQRYAWTGQLTLAIFASVLVLVGMVYGVWRRFNRRRQPRALS